MVTEHNSDINMMASLVISSIRSALNDLERSEGIDRDLCEDTEYLLKILELFVLCARKLGNDDAQLMRFHDGNVSTLVSLFQRIHDALPRNPPPCNSEILKKFGGTITNLKKEIGGWYNTLLVSVPQPTSFDEVTDISHSLLENLYGILRFDLCDDRDSEQPIQALIEKITFLRNFIRFATLRSVEPPQLLDNLLAHIHAVAVDAAHTSFMYIFPESDEGEEYDVRPNIPVLLQMIKMVDPQVDETYTQALTNSKLSTQSYPPIHDKVHDPSLIMKDFIDSLLWNLWERLHMEALIVISTNYELELVYDGLRLLRTMLEMQPNKFDKRIGELTRVVICDAGILIFSLYQRDMEIVVRDSGLLQRINRITQIVKGKDFSIPDLLQRISRIRQMVISDIKMMASELLYSIRSAVENLERSDDILWNVCIWKLKNLELFVLCARKLGNDAQLMRFHDANVSTLASLFQRIHHALPRCPPPYNSEILKKSERAIANLKKEIGGWYKTLLVSLPQPTFDEVTDFIDSLLERLNGFGFSKPARKPIEALIEKIRFLRNFIRFATLRSIEPPQLDNLLARIHAVAVDAAHTFWFYISADYGVKGEYGVVPNIPALLQMIKMVDPQVDKTYTQALTSSKLSTHLISPIPDEDRGPSDKDSDPSVVIMKDFIDSLLWNLSERLHLDTPIVISTNFELLLVYEGLRLLRSKLKEQPSIFDKRIGELTRVVICDAGILVFSLYQRDMEIVVPASGLLQRIDRITQIMKGKYFSIPDLLQRIGRMGQRVEGKDLSIPDLLHSISRIGQGLSDINMMASLVLNSIHSALNDLERSEHIPYYRGERARHLLKNLELFVLCARKFGNDAQLMRFHDGNVSTLASLFQRIHHALPRNPPPYNSEILKKFEGTIANLKKEIGGWYNTLLVSLPQPTFDEVTDIIDSVLEHLHLILKVLYYWQRCSIQLIEALIEKIRFLRNFIRFATLRSVEPPQLLENLLAHIQAVAVDAAHTSFMCICQEYFEEEEHEYAMELNIPVMLQMIKMVDPQVDKTYTQALTSAKLSTHLLSPIPDKDHDPSIIMKDFIDFLRWNLWERLHLDPPIVISTHFELRLVYEFLRLLRSMLKEQPNKFDKRIGELTRVVICDAGILIFSLYHRDMERFVPASGLLQRINHITQIVNGKDFSIPDLLQRISLIRQRVEGKDISIPDLLQSIHRAREQVGGNDLPKTNELGFIDFLLENLLGMTSSKSQFGIIYDELSSLRYSLGEIEEVRSEQKDLEALWNDGVKVAYRVEFLIDDLVLGDFQGSSSTSFDSTVEDILREVKSINSKIHPAPDIKLKKVSMAPSPVLSQNRALVADEVVGFDDDISSIINRLKIGSKELKIVAIVGMPGMGKTTLATKVFNHSSVTHHFHVRLCCCVSQLFHKKNVLSELLNLVDSNANDAMSEQDLSEELQKRLKGKRYLIFLDDVWDIKAWDSLNASFPDGSYGSRILVTSRQHHAVPRAMLDGEALSPSKLTDDQSWELIQKKLPLPLRNERSLELDELGKQIAANCAGLPLTVVIFAGLLANTEPEGWKIFLKSIRSVSSADHCKDTLDLSYKHLPGHLKECFLYFGLFPEDHEFPVRRLIRLWIAEGFVLRNKSKSIEDVARDYMMDLVGRSLVIVSKKRSRGGVKACRIHDLLHDFCRIKAKEENFLQVLRGGYDEFISFKEPDYVRRLFVHSEKKHFKNLRVFCPRLHSLLFFAHDEYKERSHDSDISFIISRHSRLKVLDISQYSLSLSFGIPSEIGLVLQLKYLSVASYSANIPSSIGSLANLETFILHSLGSDWVSMPDTFWNLQKLRHVDIKKGFRLAFEGLEKFSELCDLQSCSNVMIPDGERIERLVRKFPNIRKLHCRWDLDWNDSDDIEILIPDSLKQLESPVLTSSLTPRVVFDELQRYSNVMIPGGERIERLVRKSPNFRKLHWRLESNEIEIFIPDSLRQLESLVLMTSILPRLVFDDLPGNLRKLSLNRFLLHQSDVSKIGKLPNLEVLKFDEVNFHGDTWDMVEGEFSALRFLSLTELRIVRWTASDYQFPCLQKLVLKECRCLEEIPDRFESIDALEMVEIFECCDTVKNFFKRIQDEQKELGNSLLKIHISGRFDKL